MADDEVRALARALEGRPGDAAARWAYARALARAGDVAGERRELLALARAGDDVARVALEGPWPSPAGRGSARRSSCAPLRAVSSVRCETLWTPRAEANVARLLLGATRDVMLVSNAHVLSARGLEDLAVRWDDPGEEAIKRAGLDSQARLIAAQRQRLVALDAATGQVRAEAPLVEQAAVAVDLDRALLVIGTTLRRRVLGLADLGDRFGETLWSREVEHLREASLAGPWAVLACGHGATQRLEVLRVEDGAVVASRAGSDLDRHGPPSIVAADADGVVIAMTDLVGEGGPPPRAALMCELTLPSANVRWQREAPAAFHSEVALSREVLIVTGTGPGGVRCLQGIDRDYGEVRWTAPLAGQGLALAIAGDTCFVVETTEVAREERPASWAHSAEDEVQSGQALMNMVRIPGHVEVRARVSLRAFEVASGRVLLEADLHPGVLGAGVQVLCVDRGLVVLSGDALMRVS